MSSKKEIILSTIVCASLNTLTLGLFGTIMMIIGCVKNCKSDKRIEEFIAFADEYLKKKLLENNIYSKKRRV